MLLYFIPSICFPSHVSRRPKIHTLPLPRHISGSGVRVQKSGARSKCSQTSVAGRKPMTHPAGWERPQASTETLWLKTSGSFSFSVAQESSCRRQSGGKLLLALLLNSVFVFWEPASACNTMEVGKQPAPTPKGTQKSLCAPICSPTSSLQPIPGHAWVTGANRD